MGICIRKNNKRLLLMIFIFLIFICVAIKYDVYASEVNDSGDSEIPQYNASGSVVQVVILYQDENANYHIIQSGSGILLDENTVITNRHLTVLSEENKVAAGTYLSEQLGQTISFVPTEDGNGETATYQVAVVIEADIYNMATSSFSSADWDVATLTLASPMSKECAVLGDSDQIESGKLVSVMGFPDSTCTEPKSFQLGDLMVSEGVCVDYTGGSINHTAVMQRGNTGGALVDEYGRVVGIATYSGNEEEIYSALPINQVKAYLDRDGVAYREDLTDYDAAVEASTDTSAENVNVTIKTDLYRTLQEARMICEEGNDGIYTDDSFRELQVEYDVANKIYEDNQAEQKTIDEETERLREAIDGLEKIKDVNIILIIIIILSSMVAISLITILIIIAVRKNKKKRKEKEEQEKIKILDRTSDRYEAEYAAGCQKSVSAMQNVHNLGLPGAQLYAQFDAKANAKKMNTNDNYDTNIGTTVLQSGQGTTVLNSLVKEPVNAFLCRSLSGETVSIENDSFVIGKNSEDVDYIINDNTNISRKHAKIIRIYDNYYIEDLGSTNFTYVNGERVMPGDKQLLETNDVIYLADEEFVFLKN